MAHFRRVVAASFDPFRDVKYAKKKLCGVYRVLAGLADTTIAGTGRDGTMRDNVPVCPEATEEQ